MIGITLSCFALICGLVLSLPTLLALSIQYEQDRILATLKEEFPVTVNPHTKTILENEDVNAFFEGEASPLQAAVGNTNGLFGRIFSGVATLIAEAPWYQSLAAVSNGRFVTITPGMRKEQVAQAFGNTLAWNKTQKQQFLTASPGALLPLAEGSFSPGAYFVDTKTTPLSAQALVNEQFVEKVLSHYGTSTAAVVPLEHALTIASLIEREAAGHDDMRLISGIIWNRLFRNMNLQIDATLQYAKASGPDIGSWWPNVVPNDRFRKSPYNTYMHAGLPPAPIANPSVAMILAALNPKSTSCLFYFHDRNGEFHCTDTYAEHVELLKKYYGRGK